MWSEKVRPLTRSYTLKVYDLYMNTYSFFFRISQIICLTSYCLGLQMYPTGLSAALKILMKILCYTVRCPLSAVQLSLLCLVTALLSSHLSARTVSLGCHKQRRSDKLFIAWQAFVLWPHSLLVCQLVLLIFFHTSVWSKMLGVLAVRCLYR